MLTVEQARKLKELMGIRDAALTQGQQWRNANLALTDYIDSITVVDLKERLSPVVGHIRSMEMPHDEAIQRIINVL